MHLLFIFLVLFLFLPMILLVIFGMAMLRSVATVINFPRQMWEIARDVRTRRNHALEHATVNILEERHGPQRITGQALRDGFILFRVPFAQEEVHNAALEASRRLIGGERNLAIHKRCGTSMLASTFLVSLVFLIVLFIGGGLRLPVILGVFVLAALVSNPLGQWLQRYFTTSANVQTVSIDAVQGSAPPVFVVFDSLAAGRIPPTNYLVRTRHASEPIRVRVRSIGPPGSGQ